jgi:(p)ppGpp synthase/HD superfamily hydrolase
VTDTSDRPTNGGRDLDLVLRASAYAAEAHRDDLRKGTTIPYLSHLWSVAALVLEHGGDDEQVAAGLLHDVVEDHGGVERLADIDEQFGAEVARLVAGLSDSIVDTTTGSAKPLWKERKVQYLAHLAEADRRIQLVSACDKLHNARCIVADLRAEGSALWSRFNVSDPVEQLWYYRSLADTLGASDIPTALAGELTRTVDVMEELAIADDPSVASPLTRSGQLRQQEMGAPEVRPHSAHEPS